LTDEDRLTLVRWIDLGCPIDMAYDPAKPNEKGEGFFADRTLPTVTVTAPAAGSTATPLCRILIGLHDHYSGLDLESLRVTADFALDGIAAGENLVPRLQALPDGRWEMKLRTPLAQLPHGKLTVSVKDRQGNPTVVERTFAVGPPRR
jgi:hypothetical protein